MKLSLIVVLFIFKASQAQTMMSLEDKALPEFKIDSIVLRACINQPDYQKLNKAEREFYYLGKLQQK